MDNRQVLARPGWDQYLILVGASALIATAFLLEVRTGDDAAVYLRGSNTRIPGHCFSEQWSGLECPGCGLTRSIVCCAQGEWIRSIHFHLAGSILLVSSIGYVGFLVFRSFIPAHSLWHSHLLWPLFTVTLLALFLIQTIIRLF